MNGEHYAPVDLAPVCAECWVGRTAGLGLVEKIKIPCPCLVSTCIKICRSALNRVLILSDNYPLLPPAATPQRV